MCVLVQTVDDRDRSIAKLHASLEVSKLHATKLHATKLHASLEVFAQSSLPQLVRPDKNLAEELEKEEALAKQITEEKGKGAKLEKDLKKTKADLEEDEKRLAKDKQVLQK